MVADIMNILRMCFASAPISSTHYQTFPAMLPYTLKYLQLIIKYLMKENGTKYG